MLPKLGNSLLINQQIHANSSLKIFLVVCFGKKRNISFIRKSYGNVRQNLQRIPLDRELLYSCNKSCDISEHTEYRTNSPRWRYNTYPCRFDCIRDIYRGNCLTYYTNRYARLQYLCTGYDLKPVCRLKKQP